jgi:branched-chain amino acid transport system permease protein
MLVYGALLVFLMVFRPNGLLGGVNFVDLVLRTLGKKPHLPLRTGQKEE